MTGRATQVILLIDALGPELAERSGFLADRLPFRTRLRSVLGYSSAAIPSLLTGAVPRDHGHWFLYFRSLRRSDSPFKGARWIARLPRRIRDRWALRRRLAEWWRRSAGIKGYFGLYEVPYGELADLDYVERLDTWSPGTFPPGSFVDDLQSLNVAAHVSDWRIPDDDKLKLAISLAERPDAPEVFLLYLTEIDARQHAHGSHGAPVLERLTTYRIAIDRLLSILEARGPVTLTVCSDHGMTDIVSVVDPFPALRRTGLISGIDYRVFVDSTFLRFWPGNAVVEAKLRSSFQAVEWARVLENEELVREGVDFADGRYGTLMVLANPGVLICPSYMGSSPLKGMHGYSPDDAATDAVLLRGTADTAAPRSILDLRRLFLDDLAAARPGRRESA